MMPFLHQKFVGKERRIFCRMFGAFGFDYAKSDSQIFIFMVKSSVEDMISCLNFVIVWAWAMPMGAHCIFSSFGLGVLCRLLVHLD